MYNAKVKNYQKEALKTRVAGADRYEIIQMLMSGAVEKMVHAKVAIDTKNGTAYNADLPLAIRTLMLKARPRNKHEAI